MGIRCNSKGQWNLLWSSVDFVVCLIKACPVRGIKWGQFKELLGHFELMRPTWPPQPDYCLVIHLPETFPCLVQWYSKALLPGTLRPWLQWGALLQWYLFCMHYVLMEILHPKTARYSCHQNDASPHMKKDYGLLYWMEDSQSINVVSPTAANGSIIMAVPSKFGVTKGVECTYPCTLWSQTVVHGI